MQQREQISFAMSGRHVPNEPVTHVVVREMHARQSSQRGLIAGGNGVIVSSLDETLGRMRRAFRQVLSVISDCTKRHWRPVDNSP